MSENLCGKRRIGLVTGAGVALLPALASAAVYTATSNGNWNAPVWTPAGTPTVAGDEGVVPNGLTVNLNNTYTGVTGTVDTGGMLLVTASTHALGTLNLNGGTLNLNGQRYGQISAFTPVVNVQSASVVSGASGAFFGTGWQKPLDLQGSANLTLTGNFQAAFKETSTYSGLVTINGGTSAAPTTLRMYALPAAMKLNVPTGSFVAWPADATSEIGATDRRVSNAFSGNGTVAATSSAAFTLLSGGNLSPGTVGTRAVGTLTFRGVNDADVNDRAHRMNFRSGSSLDIDVTDSGVGDLVNITQKGYLDFDTGATVNLYLSLDPSSAERDFSHTFMTWPSRYALDTNEDEIADAGRLTANYILGAGTYSNLAITLTNTATERSYKVTGHFTPIPEPASLGLLAVGAVGLLARRRK